MRNILFTIMCFISLGLYAETLNLTVIDRDLEWPLEGVMIQIVGEDNAYYTDREGKVSIDLAQNNQRVVILAQLPGYESIRQPIKSHEREINLEMIIAGVIEGKELVVERSAPDESDEESGVSVAMDSEEMDSTANIGIVEDVMSSIKTLPGVGYAGFFNAQPSIRGGDPQAMAAMLDGIYITYPYHWGGGFSIFNPNMTESAKLSHGVFSSRYGRALSGILEVTSKTPDDDIRIDGAISTSSTDLFLQLPLGEDMGLFLGGKLTYLDTVVMLNDQQDEITTPPYIRDFYGKFNFRPTNNISIFINGFLGTDGVGVETQDSEGEITSDLKFSNDYISGFSTLGIEWSPTENNLVSLTGGYNYNEMITSADISYSGSKDYTDSFLTENSSLLAGATSYTMDDFGIQFDNTLALNQWQLRMDWDHLVDSRNLLTLGIDEVFVFTDSYQLFDGYTDQFSPGQYLYLSGETEVEGNRSINSAAYGVWEFGDKSSILQGELGIRGEHFYLWNEDMTLQTYPVANPRLQLRWDLIEKQGSIDSLTVSSGSGFFSQFPMGSTTIQKEWGLDDFEVGPDQSFYQILGTEIDMYQDWNFQLEAYYKYYFNRLYITTDTQDPNNLTYDIHQNGVGHSMGFDFMIEKKLGRKIDGYLSYSFVYTRLLNPYDASDTETSDAPLDQWYYPNYHRFSTANIVLNYRFLPGWKFTLAASYATGTPQKEVGDISSAPVLFNGEYIEVFSRESEYSDFLRNGFALPVDLRLSYTFYKKGSKWEQEFYIGVEDIFATLYTPSGVTQYNQFTGEEEPGGADFTLGFPSPSIGYKASY